MNFKFNYKDKEYSGEYTITEDDKFIFVNFNDLEVINLIGKELVFTLNDSRDTYQHGINPNVIIDHFDIYAEILKAIKNN